MKRWLFLSLVCLPVFLHAQAEIKTMSYNIRLDHDGDGEDNWHQRKADLAAYCLEESPDFLGMQEVLHVQYAYLKSELATEYGVIGVGRDDGKTKGEYAPIFYKKSRWKLLSDSTFWLSQTPQLPSKGWEANHYRICTFGRFVDQLTGDTLLISNVHFDHIAVEARKNSVALLKKHIENYKAANACILMGDFNLDPTDPLYSELSQFAFDAHEHAKAKKEIHVGTFNGFKMEGGFDKRIDYLWYDAMKLLPLTYEAKEPKTKTGRQLSDHFPVSASFLNTSTFKAKTFMNNGHTLPYRVLESGQSGKPALLVFLHGRGESGNDNWKQLIHGATTLMRARSEYGAMVIAPQCGMDDYWAAVDRKETPGGLQFDFRDQPQANPGLAAVQALIQDLIREGKVDPDRIYIAGLSMGGMGSWELLWRNPGMFAAAAPICGGGLPEKAGLISQTPVWAFHGVKDNVVNVYHSLRMLESVQMSGGEVRISLYEGVGHNAWDYAFAEEEFLQWLFSKKKK